MTTEVRAILGRTETHARALLKAVTWRAVGTVDTFVWSWLVTGHSGQAGKIAATEVLTKIIIYYFHELIWRKLPLDPDGRTRSLAKAITWRLVGSLDTFMLSLLFTGDASDALSIASAEAITKVALYYVHERAWRKVPWGRLEKPLVGETALPT